MSTLLDCATSAIDAGADEFEVTDSTGRSWTVAIGPRVESSEEGICS